MHSRKGQVVVAFAGLLAMGCDLGAAEVAPLDAEIVEVVAPGVYVGAVEKSDTLVGVSVEGGKLRIYTCAGAAQLERSTWFKGGVGEGPFELVSGEWSITGAWVDGRIEGSLHTPEGDELAWSADPVAAGTKAGLYAAATGSCKSGVVIRQAGPDAAIEARGTWCDGQGHFAQIIVLSPIVATPRGIEVQVPRRRGGPVTPGTLYVTPAAP